MDKTEHKATDIREIKTIEAVYGAFLTLIEHLSFAEITVNDRKYHLSHTVPAKKLVSAGPHSMIILRISITFCAP